MDQYAKTELIEEITRRVRASAHAARENAGYAGAWDDGGASRMLERLDAWLDGIQFARSGVTNTYRDLAARISRDGDPEYTRYLELKKKFEK